MKKITLLLLLLASVITLKAQTPYNYQLNYGNIRYGLLNGTSYHSIFGQVDLKNVGLGLVSDSILTVLNGRIRKVAKGGLIEIKLDTSSYKRVIAFDWGDSMTFGTGSTTGKSYPSQLSDLVGMQNNNRGVSGETSTQIRTRQTAATSSWGFPSIIWAGRNNYPDTTTVKADIAAMVGNLTTNKFLVISVLNSYPSEGNGSSAYTFITNLNRSLALTYGGRFVDVRKALVNSYNPSLPNDVTAFAGDIPPPSLLNADGVHLNDAGYAVVAATIAKYLDYLKSSESNYLSGLKVQSGTIETFIGKGLEISTSADGLTSYIGNVNRSPITAVPGTTVVGYEPASIVSFIPSGGTIKTGTLPSYTTGGVAPIGRKGTNGSFEILPVSSLTSSNLTVTGGTASVFGSGLAINIPATLPASVTASSLTSLGTLSSLSVSGTSTLGGNVDIATGTLSVTGAGFTVGSATANDAKALTTQSNTNNYQWRIKDAAGTVTGWYFPTLGGPLTYFGNLSATGNIAAANLVSGTYIPTFTNNTNIASSAIVGQATYSRTGNIVHVSFQASIDPTAASVTTVLYFTLPASLTQTVNTSNGVATSNGLGYGVCQYQSSTLGKVIFTPTVSTLEVFSVQYDFEVL